MSYRDHESPPYPSEASKQWKHIKPYVHGNVIDLGSGGWPIVPHAIQIELPPDLFAHYTQGREPAVPIQYGGSALDLPFKDNTIDTVFSSHLLEDMAYERWPIVFNEWKRVLKGGGHMIILTPDRARWAAALAKGQPPNCEHRHEPAFGEVGRCGQMMGLRLVVERFCDEEDYSVLTVFQK